MPSTFFPVFLGKSLMGAVTLRHRLLTFAPSTSLVGSVTPVASMPQQKPWTQRLSSTSSAFAAAIEKLPSSGKAICLYARLLVCACSSHPRTMGAQPTSRLQSQLLPRSALCLATTALRASGHRTVTQAGHHVKTIDLLWLWPSCRRSPENSESCERPTHLRSQYSAWCGKLRDPAILRGNTSE
jgi:hypothetical protein